MKKQLLLSLMMMLAWSVSSSAAIITKQYGWLESAAIEWEPVSGASDYNVYVKPSGGSYTQLDEELVRQYPSYYRADALGLKAGTYQMKVVPVDASGNEMTSEAIESGSLDVKAHDRNGFAHVGMTDGIGAYKNDGTLKDNAKVIYVWADNAKTVTTNVVTNNKGGTTAGVGLQDIVYLYQKGYETTPLAIRIIGTIKDSDMDRFDSSAEGLQVKGKGAYADMPITIEGVGEDAAIWGFGILCRNASDVEFRNFAIMLCMDDCLSLDTSNSNIWIHNMDFFYGNTGGDSDQAKGDGTVDIKGKSKNITVSYNHFIDCGKTSLGGMKSETTDCWMTYHHNWYDHSDSRHPRIRTAFYHCYNNYFDGVSKYGIGVTMGGSSFAENNYFRSTKYPFLISKQGTDAEGDGTFSGEVGGVIKAYNNTIEYAKKVQYYDGSQTDGKWDAVLVTSRDGAVNATAFTGGSSYNSAADAAARSAVPAAEVESAEAAKATILGSYGAGRMAHGDFKWSFNNQTQDPNYGVITELKSALKSYQSTLVGFADGTSISNGGATATVNGGDGVGLTEAQNTSYDWSNGSGSTVTVTIGKYVIGTKEDYFWFNEANATAYSNYVAANNFKTTGTAKTDQVVAKSDGTSCSDYIGSIRLTQNQTFTAYYADGIVSANFYVSGNGSQSWKLEKSIDGSTWSGAVTVEGKAAAHPSCVITASNDEGIKYVRITNNASGTRDLQGIKIATYDADANPDADPADDDDDNTKSSDATAEFTLNGEDIAFTGTTYTLNVAYDADDAAGYTVNIEPAENATIAAVNGATASGSSYVIAAPAAGATATATFRILAENQANTKTYTINIVKGVDPSTIPTTSGEFLYFPDGSTTYNSFYTVSGKTSNSYGNGTYVRNGESYNCNYTLKMESSTCITFTPTQNGTLKIGFSGSGSANIKVNGTKTTDTEIAVTANTPYKLEKADKAYLLYLDLVYGDGSSTGGGTTPTTETIFSTDVTMTTGSVKIPALTTQEITSAQATTTGGKIYAVNNFTDDSNPNGAEKEMIKKNTNAYGYQITNNTTCFKVVLDKALQAGDVITSKGVSNTGGERGIWVATTETRPSGEYSIKLTTPKATAAAWEDLSSYTIQSTDDLVGATTIYIHRATANSTYFDEFKITRTTSTTGIRDINAEAAEKNGTVYDVMGRKVTTLVPGQLYIKNGRKFISK